MTLDPIPCAHCGELFRPTRRSHLYHSVECRRAGPAEFGTRKSTAEREAIRRLLDESRDPQEPCLPTDWYPSYGDGAEGDQFGRLEDVVPLSVRRAWFLNLKRRGRA
jgi:hypothetical protein